MLPNRLIANTVLPLLLFIIITVINVSFPTDRAMPPFTKESERNAKRDSSLSYTDGY